MMRRLFIKLKSRNNQNERNCNCRNKPGFDNKDCTSQAHGYGNSKLRIILNKLHTINQRQRFVRGPTFLKNKEVIEWFSYDDPKNKEK